MVLQIKSVKLGTCHPWIEGLISRRYKLPYTKLTKFMSLEEAALLIHRPVNSIRNQMICSNLFYGIQINNGPLLMHPAMVLKLMKSRMQSFVKKELKNQAKAS